MVGRDDGTEKRGNEEMTTQRNGWIRDGVER